MDLANTPHKIVNGIPVALTQEEINEHNARAADWSANENVRKLASIREERDALLKSSDFRVLPDYPGSDMGLWVVYRKALRDMTMQDINNIIWPTSPK